MRDRRTWLGFGISGAAIAFLFLTADFAELGAALANANPLLVAGCIAMVPVGMYLKAYRWRLFFPDPGGVSMAGLLSALYLGYMANTVLPLRAGEILRAYLAGESERVSKSTVLGTVLIEKVLDLGTIALMLFLLRFLIPLPEWADTAAIGSGIGVAVGALGVALALVAREPSVRLARHVETRFSLVGRLHASSLLESFLDGLAFVREPRLLSAVVVWSVAVWSLALLSVYLGIIALIAWVSLSAAAFVLVVTNLGMAVPSAPGYVGVFHSAVVVSLAPFGVDASQALAAAIVLHTCVFGSFIVGGLYYLLRGSGEDGGQKGLGSLMARARSTDESARGNKAGAIHQRPLR